MINDTVYQKMIVAIVNYKNMSYFIKLNGAEKLVNQEEDWFNNILKSVTFND